MTPGHPTNPTGPAVVVAGYDPSWPATFRALRDRVAAALGPTAERIEHVGSTAVPDLPAKPIIDMVAVVATRAAVPDAITRLHPLGYRHEGDLGIAGREAFTTPPGAPPHHLYVCAAGEPELAKMIAFRDHLRAHPDAAARYARLKRDLAARFGADRAGYTDAKSTFVTEILRTPGPG